MNKYFIRSSCDHRKHQNKIFRPNNKIFFIKTSGIVFKGRTTHMCEYSMLQAGINHRLRLQFNLMANILKHLNKLFMGFFILSYMKILLGT